MPVSIKNGLRPSVLHSHSAPPPFDYWSLRPPSQPQAIRVTPPSTKHPPSSLIIASTRRRPSPHTVPSHTRAQVLRTLSSPPSSLILTCDRQRASLHVNLLGHASVCMHAQILPLRAHSLLSCQRADCERAHSVHTFVKPLV
ncbi:hypothetical protein ARMSODRAFT_452673 [Armillaria solidipes]|uniref:Uncharacterized protein n=1 Tax=Armillaria solidipes TaxID=1076256 RepID=A0A2H3B7J8_9AGAR|nr:hypothetical protein ARMSODRAFT_452673 [Armillaria solidipes]